MKKLILVTGTKRSGTTWLGNILSSNGQTGYVHEPFNPMNVKVHGSPMELTYQYVNESIDKNSGSRYSSYLDRFLAPDLKFIASGYRYYRHLDSRYVLPIRQYRDIKRADTKVIKDPCALLSTHWMQDVYNCKIVVIVRHPVAYVNSMLNKGWYFDPRVFKYQNERLKTVFSDEWVQISKIDYNNFKSDHLNNLILGWRLLNSFISAHKEPDWTIVRHEDLLESPEERFKKLYEKLGLVYNTDVETTISKLRLPTEAKQLWKEKLPLEIIEKIKIGTNEIWQNFYEDSDW